MEQVQHDITLTAQSIARVEEGVIAVEAAIQKAKAVGDSEELAALRDEKNKLLDEKNKLRDKENKLRDEKVTLLRLQGACDPWTTWCSLHMHVTSRSRYAAQSGALQRLQDSKLCWRTAACRLTSTCSILSHALCL